MSDFEEAYIPIDCGFHDLLLHYATLRQRVQVVWVSGQQTAITDAVIVDVYSHKGKEFMRLDTGEVIRLDRLVSVDGNTAVGGHCRA